MTKLLVLHIVDDDEPVRESLVYALEANGFQALSYINSDDFLTSERSEQDVLICDVRMPGMNGIELTRLLRDGGSIMPIILITGHADVALKEGAISAGADAFLEKPFRLSSLLDEIKRLTANRA